MLQEKTEKSTPNDEYENFVNVHLKAAAKCIPTKLKTKYRVPWETLAVREKRALVKTASKNYRKNPTNTNALKLKTVQYQLAGIYIKVIWRCPWCSRYRCRKWTRRHEFKSWTDCISHSTNTLGKGMNPINLPPAMGK